MIREGKYGLKVSGDGEIYASIIRSTSEGETQTYIELAPSGVLNVVGPSGGKVLEISAGADQGAISLYDNGIEKVSIMLNGAITRDLWLRTKDDNGIYLDADTGEYLMLGPCGGQTAYRGIRASGFSTDILPYQSDGANLGSSSKRWWWLKVQSVTEGDLNFEETKCAICGQTFQAGEVLGLLVKGHHPEMGTMTIPCHTACQGKSAAIEVQIPETETRYLLNDAGELEEYQTCKFGEVEEPVASVRKGYELNERTGEFKKKAVFETVVREGFRSEKTAQGLKFFKETDKKRAEVNPGIATETVETEPERPATKDEAIELVTVKRRRPIMKTVTVEIGGNSKCQY